jgi:hypothetical protein
LYNSKIYVTLTNPNYAKKYNLYNKCLLYKHDSVRNLITVLGCNDCYICKKIKLFIGSIELFSDEIIGNIYNKYKLRNNELILTVKID